LESQSQLGPSVRFGPFELDVRLGELQHNGRKVILNQQPLQLLLALLEQPGELVSREDLVKRLWPDGTFVDYERGLNKAVNKLRDALRDSADSPRFVETIPRRGYRFIGHLEPINPSAVVPVPEPAEVQTSKGKPHRFSVAGVLGGLLLLIVVGFWIYTRSSGHSSPLNLQNMQITRLTENGKASDVAISPDGRYVVYVLAEGQRQSLWVRQVAAESAVQILPADPAPVSGLSFSPDGNYIYFLRSDGGSFNVASLYQMPVLGATPRLLIQDIDTPITFSADGERVAFIRGNPEKGESYLVTADKNGRNEKVLATEESLQSFALANFSTYFGFTSPAWSPDGKTIVASVSEGIRGGIFSVLAVSVSDGKARKIYSSHNFIGPLRWLPSGDGLLMIMADPVTGLNGQIWYLPYPHGTAQRLTNDLTNYNLCCLDLTTYANTIATVENNYVADLWLAPAGATDKALQITSNAAIVDASWLTGNKIILQNIKGDLLTVDHDGANHMLLTPDAHNVRTIAACGDGRHIVYESLRSTEHIWVMNADGSNPTQLTSGDGESFPDCSPDGKWVVYLESDRSVGFRAWRVNIDGGKRVQLAHAWAFGPRISPDGRLVMYTTLGPKNEHDVIVVVDAVSGQRMYSWDIPAGTHDPHWAQDGQAVDYVMTRDSVSNLWRQPLSGGPAKPVTDFKSGSIFRFGWSRDGKQLLLVRGDIRSDVILIRNFK
jgi:eukaryotic-like serine/threonine-protein kinase